MRLTKISDFYVGQNVQSGQSGPLGEVIGVTPEAVSIKWNEPSKLYRYPKKMLCELNFYSKSISAEIQTPDDGYKFKPGDRITKPEGYKFPGTVLSCFVTLSGKKRVVAEVDELGMLHIFNESQLEKEDGI